MMTAGFPEPLTFSLRARRLLKAAGQPYDVVHDNQCLGYGLLGIDAPLVTTVHHPIQIDREIELPRRRLAGAGSRSALVRVHRHAAPGRPPAAACDHGVGVLR